MIAPEHLPVDYGGTARALQSPSYDIPVKDNRLFLLTSTHGGRKTLWRLLAGGEAVYEIRGLHAVVLFLALWALHRESASLGEAALLALALVFFAKEWVGSLLVTLPSAKLCVPLLHDPGVVVQAAALWSSNKIGVSADDENGNGTVGSLRGVDSLVGTRVKIVEVVGTGQSGFDRFCIKIQSTQTVSEWLGIFWV